MAQRMDDTFKTNHQADLHLMYLYHHDHDDDAMMRARIVSQVAAEAATMTMSMQR